MLWKGQFPLGTMLACLQAPNTGKVLLLADYGPLTKCEACCNVTSLCKSVYISGGADVSSWTTPGPLRRQTLLNDPSLLKNDHQSFCACVCHKLLSGANLHGLLKGRAQLHASVIPLLSCFLSCLRTCLLACLTVYCVLLAYLHAKLLACMLADGWQG